MKRVEPESVGDVLRQALSDNGLNERLYETRAINIWPVIVGEQIAAMTGRPVVYKGLMTVYVRNASLRQELNMSRSMLKRHINEALGRETITDLHFR